MPMLAISRNIPSLTAYIKFPMARDLHHSIAKLARCSPGCGIFHTRENQAVREIMQQVLSAKNIFDSANRTDLVILQQYAPIFVKFLHATTKGGVESPFDVVSELLTHNLDVYPAP